MPERIESQQKLYPLTDAKKNIDFSSISTDSQEITPFGEDGPHRLDDVLKLMFPNDQADQKQVLLKRDAVKARAVANGYNVSVVHPGDVFQIKDNFLFIDNADGSQHAIPLKDAVVLPSGSQYTLVDKRENVRKNTQKAFLNLQDVFKSGMLRDTMNALGLDFTDEKRQEIWAEMQNINVSDLRKNSALKKIPDDFLNNDYEKTALQNTAMVEYLKIKNAGNVSAPNLQLRPLDHQVEQGSNNQQNQIDGSTGQGVDSNIQSAPIPGLEEAPVDPLVQRITDKIGTRYDDVEKDKSYRIMVMDDNGSQYKVTITIVDDNYHVESDELGLDNTYDADHPEVVKQAIITAGRARKNK